MRRWVAGFVAAVLPLAIASYALPQYHLLLWGLFGWSATAAVVVGVVRNRPHQPLPWVFVAGALMVFVTGNMVYDVLAQVLHYEDLFPSVADLFFLATYPLFVCGLLGLLRSRSPQHKIGPLLDAVIVTTSCGIFVLEPYVRAANVPLLEKLVSIAYPIGDLAVLCVLAMLVFTCGLRNWSVRLLTVGALGLLVSDVFYGRIQLDGTWNGVGPTNVGWLAFYICWGAASLHPSMRQLTEPRPPREAHLNMTAVVVLGATTLIAPGLLVWRAASGGKGGDLGVIGIVSSVVFLLVIARLIGLVRAQAAQIDRERALVREVEERKVVEEALWHQAFHDSLTRLPNRLLFYDRVEHALTRRSRLRTDVVGGAPRHEVSVLLIDIDDFKAVNDTLGHAAGDEILVQFAARLLGCLRGDDTAARLGGDEFAVCIEGRAGRTGVAAAAQRILEAMSQPFRVAEADVDARVSIGISTAGDTAVGPLDMLRDADLALYAAKQAGKGSFRVFEDSLHPAAPPALSRRAQPEQATVLGEQTRRDPRWADLERLRTSHRMMDAVVEEVHGRRIRIGDHWLSDFASCNYLGLDVDKEIIDSVDAELRRWGTHPSWSRLLGSPRLYCDIEDQLTELLGAPDTLVLPTITHIHTAVIPILAGQGWLFVDARAHKTIHDAASIAAGQGAVLRRFRSDDGRSVEDLERQLDEVPHGMSRLVCMDGVNSMTGNVPDLAEFARAARARGALLYIDDAHGFGLIGERGAQESTPYGLRGNSIVRHTGQTYDNLVLVGGFSKSYSSLLAFLALPTWLKNHLKIAAPPYLYSGPSPTASLATVLAGMRVNAARGDTIREDLYRKTARVLDAAKAVGLDTPNRSGLPIIEVPLHRAADLDAVGEFLFDQGIYVTLAAYPLVPRSEVGIRIQVTAANTDDQIDQLCDVLATVRERFLPQGAPRSAYA
jgi:8-amino-7-oxononanoate synthase